ncbi:MAG: TIGR01906 family membrane protein [Anaerolineales bacterium]|nr:TIGR01906 family membrane protein [Anaerolineales bacterium]
MPPLKKTISWLVTLLVPIAIALAAVRIVINPWFVEFEYRTPGFPEDRFDFTLQDRLYYSRIAIDYLLNDADISFLGDLRFPEGEQAPAQSCLYMDDCTRLYNDRELEHMLDVKLLVQAALRVWVGSLVLLALLEAIAWRMRWNDAYRDGLVYGGYLTLMLIVAIILLVVLAFGFIFVKFHEVFFAADTWMFLYSDTLIRLFPERFWRDTFLMVGSLTAGMALALPAIFRWIPRWRNKKMQRSDNQ